MISFGKYSKSVAALVGAAITWGQLVVHSAPAAITGNEWLTGGLLLATALGVYGVTNKPVDN